MRQRCCLKKKDLGPKQSFSRKIELMKKEMLLSSREIQRRVNELGEEIAKDYRGAEPILIGVLNGVVFFFADLVRAIHIPTKIDFVRASSYGSGTSSSGHIKLTKDVELPIQSKPVILVEDIVDTGLTLQKIKEKIQQKGPESIKICALIDKKERREIEIKIDYCGFEVEKGFLVGYGLDFDEKYRYLPDIFVLR